MKLTLTKTYAPPSDDPMTTAWSKNIIDNTAIITAQKAIVSQRASRGFLLANTYTIKLYKTAPIIPPIQVPINRTPILAHF